MSVTIDNDLTTFKEKVSPCLANMNSTLTSLQNKVQDSITANEHAKSGLETYYNSDNKSTILSKFTTINEVFNKIKTSLESDLKSMISKSQEIVTNVSELEKLKSEIEEKECALSSEKSKTEPNNSTISSLSSTITAKTSEFNSLLSLTRTSLSNLKSMDASLSFTTEFAKTDYDALGEAVGGTFEKKVFKAKDGQRITYYIWVPEFASGTTDGFPVMTYLHGSGERGNGVLNTGLPKAIKNGYKPNGIVICVQGEHTFSNVNFEHNIVELTQAVVEEYHADPNRLSLSGHSDGAIGGYQLLRKNPGVFSSFIPISGYTSTDGEGFKQYKDVKIWAFHGSKDTSCDYSHGASTVKNAKSAGSDAILTTLQGEGHCIQNSIFDREYVYDGDGESYNPLDWAFHQSKESI